MREAFGTGMHSNPTGLEDDVPLDDVERHQVMADANASSGAQTGNSSGAVTGSISLAGGGADCIVSSGVASSAINDFLLYYIHQFLAEAGGDDFPDRFLSGLYSQLVGTFVVFLTSYFVLNDGCVGVFLSRARARF